MLGSFFRLRVTTIVQEWLDRPSGVVKIVKLGFGTHLFPNLESSAFRKEAVWFGGLVKPLNDSLRTKSLSALRIIHPVTRGNNEQAFGDDRSFSDGKVISHCGCMFSVPRDCNRTAP